uniref:Uncharacterized protein n=1 Tax=Parascaris equorum TaxID=6256 RepID=A0A914RVA7_PAREQ
METLRVFASRKSAEVNGEPFRHYKRLYESFVLLASHFKTLRMRSLDRCVAAVFK